MNEKQARKKAAQPLLLRSVSAEGLLKAMRRKCLECCSGSKKLVKACKTTDCALYPYRNCYTLVQADMFTPHRRTTEQRRTE